MIEAWFQTSEGVDIGCVVPEGEILEIAAMIGLQPSDLFQIDIPAGASRHARATLLIAGSVNLSSLYASATFAAASATLFWRESQASGTTRGMYVSLLPPRPLFQQTDALSRGTQIWVVECVDVRYWWNRAQTALVSQTNTFSQFFGSDGRWQTSELTVAGGMTLPNLLEYFRSVLPIGTWNAALYTPNVNLIHRVADLNLTPECTLGLAVDLLLSQTGYILEYDMVAQEFKVVEVKDDTADLNAFMSDEKRAAAGGLEAMSDTPTTATEEMLETWAGLPNYQVNRAPQNVAMSFQLRAPEGVTLYGNGIDTQSFPYPFLEFAKQKETAFGTYTIPTVRSRLVGPAYILKEPRALTAKSSFSVDTTTISDFGRTAGSLGVGWDYATYITKCRDLLVKRVSMRIGRVAWAGWPALPLGAYRGTMLRYTIGIRGGQLVPFTLTECDEDDWIFGPSGVPTTDPKDIVFSKGAVHARRLNNGALQIDVPPPNVRIFPAKITGSTRVGASGNAFWQWAYEWEEVEPNPLAFSPPIKDGLQLKRISGTTYKAQNLMEAGNVYVSAINPANRIAGGVLQADYLCTAIVEALPICNDTVVMMAEHFPTLYEDDTSIGPYQRAYWFSVPNAVKTTCYTCFGCDGNYGTFDTPNPSCSTNYGTFEAPENSNDYGVF